MLHVRGLPVVKIALLFILSENDYMYFICCLSGCGVGACNLLKLFEQLRGVGCVFAVSCPTFLAWSVVVNLPNNGVLLCLQKLFDLNYFI